MRAESTINPRPVSVTFDYNNHRVSRTVTKGGQITESRNYLYYGNQVIEETLNGQRLALYGWGPDGLESRTDAQGHSLFYLKDGLGSVMAIIDEKANIVQSYEYSAFGECLSGKDAVNEFRFIGGFGGQTDDATGLTYFWNRFYDSQTGRWVNEDLDRQASQNNLYQYVLNRPSRLLDPSGLRGVEFGVVTAIRPPATESGLKTNDDINVDSDTGSNYVVNSMIGPTMLLGIPFAGSGKLNHSSSGNGGCLNVHFDGTSTSYFLTKPFEIRYNFDITYDADNGTGHISGSHKGFPSYEVWVDNRQIYDFQQEHFLELAGPDIINVNEDFK